MNMPTINLRMLDYKRQFDDGLINAEEWRLATINFLISPEVEIYTLRSAYEVTSNNLLAALTGDH